MPNMRALRDTYMSKGSYFYKMFHAGGIHDRWLEIALSYLPDEILDQLKDRLLFITNTHRDACRLPRSVVKEREIICLSEHIMPKEGANDAEPKSRYFIFCVLHEIAHAFRKHLSPTWDDLTTEQNDEQEHEADEMALAWFNSHVGSGTSTSARELTMAEVREQQAYFRDLREREQGCPSKTASVSRNSCAAETAVRR